MAISFNLSSQLKGAHTHTHTHIYTYRHIYIEAGCKKQCLYDKLSNVKTDILDGYQGQYKTVIICQSATEVDELVTFLESQCFQILAAHEDMAPYRNIGKYTFLFHCWHHVFYMVQFKL
jgi:hypothetical protein